MTASWSTACKQRRTLPVPAAPDASRASSAGRFPCRQRRTLLVPAGMAGPSG